MISMVNINAIKSIDNRDNNDAIKLMDKKEEDTWVPIL